MKNKFTKAKRHKYYSKALKVIQHDTHTLVCSALDIVSNYRCHDYETDWPEFAEQRPNNKPWGGLWFPETKTGQAKRIAILKKCISETNHKKL